MKKLFILCLITIAISLTGCKNKILTPDQILNKLSNEDYVTIYTEIDTRDIEYSNSYHTNDFIKYSKIGEFFEIEQHYNNTSYTNYQRYIILSDYIYRVYEDSKKDYNYARYNCKKGEFSTTENYGMHINERISKPDIDVLKYIEEYNGYKYRYDIEDYLDSSNDWIINNLIKKNELIDSAFVEKSYTFNDDVIEIMITYDLDGISNVVKNGKCLEIKMTISFEEIEDIGVVDTCKVQLVEDINSSDIRDLTGFNKFILDYSIGSIKNGFFKIRLESGTYCINLLDSESSYRIFNSNKELLDVSDRYRLESGVYYFEVINMKPGQQYEIVS